MVNYQNKIISIFTLFFFIVSCRNNKTENAETKETKSAATEKPMAAESKPPSSSTSAAEDGPAIATIETSDYILKIHKVVPFTLKPKSYEPLKVAADTKLAVLDISVRNKLSSPLNFSRILGMTEIRGKANKMNMMAPWVVAAYITDYPYPNHQKEYDALWSSSFEGNGFHRAMLLGLNPKKEENEFTLIVPEKPDFNNPSRKELKFSL